MSLPGLADINPLGQNPVARPGRAKPQDITPVELEPVDVVFCYRKGGSES